DYKGFRGYLHDVLFYQSEALTVKEVMKYVQSKKASIDAIEIEKDSVSYIQRKNHNEQDENKQELDVDLTEPLAILKENEPVLYQALSGFLRQPKGKSVDELLFLELIVLLKTALLLPKNDRSPHPKQTEVYNKIMAAIDTRRARQSSIDLAQVIEHAKNTLNDENQAYKRLQWVNMGSAAAQIKMETNGTIHANPSQLQCTMLAAVACLLTSGEFVYEVTASEAKGVRVGWLAPQANTTNGLIGEDLHSFGFDGCHIYHNGNILASVENASLTSWKCAIDFTNSIMSFNGAIVPFPPTTSWMPAMSIGFKSFMTQLQTKQSTMYPSVWQTLGYQLPLNTVCEKETNALSLLQNPCVEFYPNLGTSTRLSPSIPVSATVWTLSFYIYPSPVQDATEPRPWRTIFLKGQDSSMQRTPSIFLSYDRLLLAVCVSTKSDWNSTLVSSASLAANRWTHVAVVCEGLTLRLIINGKEDKTLSLPDKVLHNKHPFHFGKTPLGVKKATTDYKGFRGYLHDVLFYQSEALTVKEVMKYVQSKKASIDAIEIEKDSVSCTLLQNGISTDAITINTTWSDAPKYFWQNGAMTASPDLLQACNLWPQAFYCESIAKYTPSSYFQVLLGIFNGPDYLFVFGITNQGKLCVRSKERQFCTAQKYITPGEWHRMGLTYSLNQVDFYIDGVLVERLASSGSTLDPQGIAQQMLFVVGGCPETPRMKPWQGGIGLTRVLQFPPLSQSNSEVARWAFNEGHGTIIYDSSNSVPLWHGSVVCPNGWHLDEQCANTTKADSSVILKPTDSNNLADKILYVLEPLASRSIHNTKIKLKFSELAFLDTPSSILLPHVLTFLVLHSILQQWLQDKDLLDANLVVKILRILRANFEPLTSISASAAGLPPSSVGLGVTRHETSFGQRLRDLLNVIESLDWFDDDVNEALRVEAISTHVSGFEVFYPTPTMQAELLLRLLSNDTKQCLLDNVCSTLVKMPHLVNQFLPPSPDKNSVKNLFPWTIEEVKKMLLSSENSAKKDEVINSLQQIPRMASLKSASPEHVVVVYEEWYNHYATSHTHISIDLTKSLLKDLLMYVASHPQMTSVANLVVMLQSSVLESLHGKWEKSTISRLLQWHHPPRYFKVVNCSIGVRETPNIKAPKTGRTLSIGQVIESTNVWTNQAVQYVELASGDGWVFDVDPSDGMLLLEEHGPTSNIAISEYSLTGMLSHQSNSQNTIVDDWLQFKQDNTDSFLRSDDAHIITKKSTGPWCSAFGSKVFSRGSGIYTWRLRVQNCSSFGQLLLGISAKSCDLTSTYIGNDKNSFGWLLTGDSYHNGHRLKNIDQLNCISAGILLEFKVNTNIGSIAVLNAETGVACSSPFAFEFLPGESYRPTISLFNAGDSVSFEGPCESVDLSSNPITSTHDVPSIEPTPLATFYARTLLQAYKQCASDEVMQPIITPFVANMCCWTSVDDELLIMDTVEEILLHSKSESDATLVLGCLSGHLYGRLISSQPSNIPVEEKELQWLSSLLFQGGLRPKNALCPSLFYKQFMDGQHGSFDKWVLKFANASPLVVRMGGTNLDKAIRCILGCMLYHCGMSSYAEMEDKANSSRQSPCPKPLRVLWQKAYELKAWALRHKNTANVSYDSIASMLLAKVEFLLKLAPCKADDGIGVYYHEPPTLTRKISMGKRSNSFDSEDIDKNASLLDTDLDIITTITKFCRSDCNVKKLHDHLHVAQFKATQRASSLRRTIKLVQSVPQQTQAAILLHVVSAIRNNSDSLWHYYSGISGCPYAMKRDVKAAFESYYNCLIRHLSVADDNTSWQLLLLDAIAVRVLPEDHGLLASCRVFHVLQDLLDRCLSTVRNATMQVVYLLAVQVASEGEQDDRRHLNALTPPSFQRQLSGPQTLSTAVFDMLYAELYTVVMNQLEAHKVKSRYLLDTIGDHTSLLGILSLLQFVSVSSICQTFLSTTSWISLFVTIACFGHVEPQVRSLQLLTTLLPLCNPAHLTFELPFNLESYKISSSSICDAASLLRFFTLSIGQANTNSQQTTLPRSSRTTISLASECVCLLRTLLADLTWQPMVVEILETQFKSGSKQAQLGVLGVLGSFIEPIRFGGLVQLEDRSTATVVDTNCDATSAYVKCDNGQTSVLVSVNDVTAVPKQELYQMSSVLGDAVLEQTANLLLSPPKSEMMEVFLKILQAAHLLFRNNSALLYDVVAKSPAIARRVFELGGTVSNSSGLPCLKHIEIKYEMLRSFHYRNNYKKLRDALYPMPSIKQAESIPIHDQPNLCEIKFEEGILCTLKQVSTYDTPVSIASDAMNWIEALLNHMLFKSVKALTSNWASVTDINTCQQRDVQLAIELVYTSISLPEMLQAACAEANEWLTNREHWGAEWTVHENSIVDYLLGQINSTISLAQWRERIAALQIGPYLCATCECLAADVLSLSMEVSRGGSETENPVITFENVLQAMHDDEELNRLLEYHQSFLNGGQQNEEVKPQPPQDKVLDVRVESMMAMGFPEAWCKRALEESNQEVNSALNWILSNGHLLEAPATPHTAPIKEEEVKEIPPLSVPLKEYSTSTTFEATSNSSYSTFWSMGKDPVCVIFDVKAASDAVIGLFTSENLVYEIVLGAKRNSHCEAYLQSSNDEKRVVASDTGAYCDEANFLPYWIAYVNNRVIVGSGKTPSMEFMILDFPSTSDKLSRVSFSCHSSPVSYCNIAIAPLATPPATSWHTALLNQQNCIRPLDDPEQMSDMNFCFYDESKKAGYKRDQVYYVWAPSSSRVGYAERAEELSEADIKAELDATANTLQILYARRLGIGVLAVCKSEISVLLDVFDGYKSLFVPFVSLVAHRYWVSDFIDDHPAPSKPVLIHQPKTTEALLKPTMQTLCRFDNSLRTCILEYLSSQMDAFLANANQSGFSWNSDNDGKLDEFFKQDADLLFLLLITKWVLDDEATPFTQISTQYKLHFIWTKALQSTHLEVQQKALEILSLILYRARHAAPEVTSSLVGVFSQSYLEHCATRLLSFEDELYPLFSRYFQAEIEFLAMLKRLGGPRQPSLDSVRFGLYFKGSCSYVAITSDDVLPPWTAMFSIHPMRSGPKAIIASSANGCIQLQPDGIRFVNYREQSSVHLISASILYDQWSALAVVASNTSLSLYLNGNIVGACNVEWFQLPMQFIGHDQFALKGYIANVRYFNSALLPTHIAELSAIDLHQRSGIEQSKLPDSGILPALSIIGHWPLQEGAGNHVYDLMDEFPESHFVGTAWVCHKLPSIHQPHRLSMPTNELFSGSGTWTRETNTTLGGSWTAAQIMAFKLTLYSTGLTSTNDHKVMGRLLLNARIMGIVEGTASAEGNISIRVTSIRQDVKNTFTHMEWMLGMEFNGSHSNGELLGTWSASVTQTTITHLPKIMSFLPSFSDTIDITDGGRRVQSLLRKGKKRATAILCTFGIDAVRKHWSGMTNTDLNICEQLDIFNRTDTFVTIRCASLITSGKVYYEYVLKSKGLMQLGWAYPGFRPAFTTHGVGDHFGSFGVDGKRRKKWCNTGQSYGPEHWSWSAGDIIGVLLDMDSREIRFAHNGVDLGVAFTEKDYPQIDWASGFYPTGSFSSAQGAKINLGATPFQYNPPHGYVSVQSVAPCEKVEVFNHRTKQFVALCTHHRVNAAPIPIPISLSRGQYLWEFEITNLQTSDGIRLGIATHNVDTSILLGNDSYGWGFCATGKTYHNNSSNRFTSTGFTQGDVVGMELNMDAGTLVIYRNNVLLGTAFSNLHLELPMDAFVTGNGGLIPCVSLYRPQSSVYIRGLKHGNGSIVYPSNHVNDRYDGEWKYGKRNGLGTLTLRNKEGCYIGNWVDNKQEGPAHWVEPFPLCVPTMYLPVWKTLKYRRSLDHPIALSRTDVFKNGKLQEMDSKSNHSLSFQASLPVETISASANSPWYPSVRRTLSFIEPGTEDAMTTTSSIVKLSGTWQTHSSQLFTLVPPPSSYDMITVNNTLTGVKLESHACTGTHLLVRGNTSYSSGVHYWEVTIESCSHGSVFLGVVANTPTPSTDGWGDYGFVSYRVKWNQNEGEQLYGRYFSAGDTIGIRLDMNCGTLAFLKDGDDFVRGRPAVIDMGIAFRFLRSQSTRKNCSFCPAFGLSYPGDALSVRYTKGVSVPVQSRGSRVVEAVCASSLLQEIYENPNKYPTQLLNAAHQLHSAMTATGLFQPKTYRTRGETIMHFTSSSYESALQTTRGNDQIPTRHGTAKILGQVDNLLWYIIEGEEAAGAWYWTLSEVEKLLDQEPIEESTWSCMACTMLNEPTLSKCQICETPRAQDVVEEAPMDAESTPRSSQPFIIRDVKPDESWPLAKLAGKSDANFEKLVSQEKWMISDDQNLVLLVDALCDQMGEDPENLPWSDIWKHISPSFTSFASEFVAARWSCLLVLNTSVAMLLPYLDFNGDKLFKGPNSTTARALTSIRDLIFKRYKTSFWKSILEITTTHTTPPSDEYDRPESIREISLNRIQALEDNCPFEKTIFGQLFKEISTWDAQSLRRAYADELQDAGQPRAFYVKCLGEGVDDHGGPYRAIFQTAGWEEPIGSAVHLFEPCTNAVQSSGANQDKYIVSAKASPAHLKFLGQLVGLAIRHRIMIPFNCSDLFWKPLVGLSIDRKDWSGIDTTVVRELYDLECLGEDEIAALDKHEIIDHLLRVAQTTSKLTMDYEPLNCSTVSSMVEECVAHRLATQTERLLPLMKGLAMVVPHAVLSLFTSTQLEELVCGSPEIDIEMLQRITVYDGVDPSEPHIHYFWSCLTDMTHEQRSSFVNFVLARSRLPRSIEEFTLHFKIQPAICPESANPDMYLPHSQTCFFSLSLPRYSSKEICMEKLLYAISHSPTMDADFIERGPEGWEGVGP
ncbi:HECT E3 ubiquitin ligase, partial [Thraustotheca clavata]